MYYCIVFQCIKCTVCQGRSCEVYKMYCVYHTICIKCATCTIPDSTCVTAIKGTQGKVVYLLTCYDFMICFLM